MASRRAQNRPFIHLTWDDRIGVGCGLSAFVSQPHKYRHRQSLSKIGDYSYETSFMKPKILITLRDYSVRLLIGNILGGVTVALVALPLSIAIAIASGATPAPSLPKWWLPDDIQFVAELPKSATGKFPS